MTVTLRAPARSAGRSPSPARADQRAQSPAHSSSTVRLHTEAQARSLIQVAQGFQLSVPEPQSGGALQTPVADSRTLPGIREAIGYIQASHVTEVDPINLTWSGLYALQVIEPSLSLQERRPENGDAAWELVVTAKGKTLGTYPLDQTYDTQLEIIEDVFAKLKTESPAFARVAPEARRATFLRGIVPELATWAQYLTPEEITQTLRQFAPATNTGTAADAPPPPPSISRKEIWDTTGLIELPVFGALAHTEISEALTDMRSKGVKDVIIDLRENDGGLLNTAVASADLFVQSGQILAQRGRDSTFATSHDAVAGDPHEGKELRVVILVSGNTASAAEVFAAALADVGRAVLVGTPTYGKASSQWHAPLATGDGFKLTVSEFTGPTGATIDMTGLVPSVCVTPGQSPSPRVLSEQSVRAAHRTRHNPEKIFSPELAGQCAPGTPSTGVAVRVAEALLRDHDAFERALDAQKRIAEPPARPSP